MKTVYVGSFPSFASGVATFTNKSLGLTVQKVEGDTRDTHLDYNSAHCYFFGPPELHLGPLIHLSFSMSFSSMNDTFFETLRSREYKTVYSRIGIPSLAV